MKTYDAQALLIRGATVVNADAEFSADVLCAGGRIVAIGEHAKTLVPQGAQHFDGAGQYLMPGGIDPHTHLKLHFGDISSLDDFWTGSVAALAGGTTTFLDFVVPEPEQSLRDAYEVWRLQAERSAIDYGFHAVIRHWDRQMSEDMAHLVSHEGINSFKLSMANDKAFVQGLEQALALGALPMVPASSAALISVLQQELERLGIHGPQAFRLAHQPMTEAAAVQRSIALANKSGVPLYFVHLSCADSVEAIMKAREQGMRVYGEVLVGNLLIDESIYQRPGTQFEAVHTIHPPFRSRQHRQWLWQGLQSGGLHTVSSNHSTFSHAQRRAHRVSAAACSVDELYGFDSGGGIEERMPLIWDAGVNTGLLSPSDFVAVTSANSARLFNLFPRKGCITEGADADLVLWDPQATRTLSLQQQQSCGEFNLFEGRRVRGWPSATISRGQVVWRAGDLRADLGRGRYVKRTAFGSRFAALNPRTHDPIPSAALR